MLPVGLSVPDLGSSSIVSSFFRSPFKLSGLILTGLLREVLSFRIWGPGTLFSFALVTGLYFRGSRGSGTALDTLRRFRLVSLTSELCELDVELVETTRFKRPRVTSAKFLFVTERFRKTWSVVLGIESTALDVVSRVEGDEELLGGILTIVDFSAWLVVMIGSGLPIVEGN